MDFVTAKDKAAEWNISLRRVQVFCEQGRIEGVQRLGKVWVIPKDAQKPLDGRTIAARKTLKKTNKKRGEKQHGNT